MVNRFGPNIRERVAFIATKCDTQLINCDELAQNLGLECDSDFIRIKGELAKIEDEMRLCEYLGCLSFLEMVGLHAYPSVYSHVENVTTHALAQSYTFVRNHSRVTADSTEETSTTRG